MKEPSTSRRLNNLSHSHSDQPIRDYTWRQSIR
jgi:hypothetical protein